MAISKHILITLMLLGLMSFRANASAEADANNPLANLTAFNIQGYHIGELTGTDTDAFQWWLRYAKPVNALGGQWLLRASLPFNSFPDPEDLSKSEFGTGDFNTFFAYLFDTGNPAVSFGLGPNITAPTASDDILGSRKWQAGATAVLFDARSKRFQWGFLLNWQADFAGSDNAPDVNLMALQPFAFYQLGDGHYLRAAPIWNYNFENDHYGVPVGVGYGKVIKQGKTVYNLFIEPQFSVADDGPGQPEWQVYFALNMQFYN